MRETENKMSMENLYNVKQAAYILKVHHLTIRRYIKEGKLKAIRAGGNIRIKESDLAEFNKDFSSKEQQPKSPFRKLKTTAKIFTVDDPLFRLKGRGASLHLSIDQK